MDMKFAAVCLIAVIGWASNCVSEQSTKLHEARERALETNLRVQETLNRNLEQRASQYNEELNRANAEAALRRAELGECFRSESDLRRQLNLCNQRSDDQPPHFHATIPVEPATP